MGRSRCILGTVLPVARNFHSEIQLAYIVQKSVVSYVFIVQEMVSVQERVREDFGACRRGLEKILELARKNSTKEKEDQKSWYNQNAQIEKVLAAWCYYIWR